VNHFGAGPCVRNKKSPLSELLQKKNSKAFSALLKTQVAFRDGTGRDPTEHPENELTKKHGDSLEKLLDCDVSPVLRYSHSDKKSRPPYCNPTRQSFFLRKKGSGNI
jgi:hypothetical protein